MGLRIRLLARNLPFISPFFCLLRLNLCHRFLRNCKLESSNVVYICRMSDCIMGSRLRVMAFIFLFYPFFFLSLYYMLTLKICVGFFLGIFKARMSKLGIHMDNKLLYCGIEK